MMDLQDFLLTKDNVDVYEIKEENDDMITLNSQYNEYHSENSQSLPLNEEYILPTDLKQIKRDEETPYEEESFHVDCLQEDTHSEDSNEVFTISEISNVIELTDSSLTKCGNVRKRKKYILTKSDRINFLKHKHRSDHQLKPPCTSTCRKHCSSKISDLCRQKINDMFWSANWCEQKSLIKKMTTTNYVARKTVEKSRRVYTFTFLFLDDHGQSQNVCQTFFLTTLGYNKNNNTILKSLSVGNETPHVENRGKYLRELTNKNNIKSHIESFNPVISHYHHEQLPDKKYLPSDVTIKIMFDSFHDKNPTIKCSYDTYRRVVKELNVSFTTLANEECEMCAAHKNIEKKHKKCDVTCEICTKYNRHRRRAQKSHDAYEFCNTSSSNETEICASIGLQKIIMLPRIEMFPQILCTNRIRVFNESFVPVGKLNNVKKPMAVMWHEAVSGCISQDIISSFYKFFLYYRDMKKFQLWLDNCVSQNKNWTMFSFLAALVNSPTINAAEIELVYFEPGHICTSADSFQHQIELNLKKQKNTYDFNDFREAVETVNKSHVIVDVMSEQDFHFWKDNSAQTKLKKNFCRTYLNDMVRIKFKRGNSNLFYSVDYDGDNFIEFPFLKNSFVKTGLTTTNRTQKPSGISETHRKQILKDVLPLLPANRHSFWKNLLVRDSSFSQN